jgi:hypothetical protein
MVWARSCDGSLCVFGEAQVTPANQVRSSIIAASKAGARLFKMNVALSWAGSKIKKHDKSETYFCPAGSITIHDPRPIKSGIPGLSDTLGWSQLTITPEMVGTRIPVITAVEDKGGTGRLTPEQRAFLNAVISAGGRAGVSRSDEDTVLIVTGQARALGL